MSYPEHTINRKVLRGLTWTCLALTIVTAILQTSIRCSKKSSGGQREYNSNVSEVLYAVDALALCVQVLTNYAWPSCSTCDGYVVKFGAVAYVTSRALTIIFMLQRAQMSQNIAPVLSKKWFTRYFPITIFVAWLAFSCAATTSIDGDADCHYYNGSDYCQYVFDNQKTGTVATAVVGATVDVVIAIGILYLLVKPFLSIKAIAENKRIRQMLRWSIWMIATNLCTTLGIQIGVTLISQQFEYLQPIDRVVNVVTVFLMIERNRQSLTDAFGEVRGRQSQQSLATMQSTYNKRRERKVKCTMGHRLIFAEQRVMLINDYYANGFVCGICERIFSDYEFVFHCFECIGEYYDVCAGCGIVNDESTTRSNAMHLSLSESERELETL